MRGERGAAFVVLMRDAMDRGALEARADAADRPGARRGPYIAGRSARSWKRRSAEHRFACSRKGGLGRTRRARQGPEGSTGRRMYRVLARYPAVDSRGPDAAVLKVLPPEVGCHAAS
jgi:hypothetical protein